MEKSLNSEIDIALTNYMCKYVCILYLQYLFIHYSPNIVVWLLVISVFTTDGRPWQIGHSVEAPSMVDHQWNILYWGSGWIFQTVCWGEVGCEWGTTIAYFGITCVCFFPGWPHVFAGGPSTIISFFVKSIFWRTYINLQKHPCGFKILMGFVVQILI